MGWMGGGMGWGLGVGVGRTRLQRPFNHKKSIFICLPSITFHLLKRYIYLAGDLASSI